MNNIIPFLLLGILLFYFLKKFLLVRNVKNYSVAEVASLLPSGDVVLLDVRTKEERQQSSIRDSLHIPLHELEEKASELDKHKSKEIICYCKSGNRSLIAASKLHQRGFQSANMKGGISEWNFHQRNF
ncbi:MAG: rhodanese-like domain-containing protein [Ignavibacteria bacterium]|nr:rhodanese-like domain-containing protein [Ignavibacteria bacterium]